MVFMKLSFLNNELSLSTPPRPTPYLTVGVETFQTKRRRTIGGARNLVKSHTSDEGACVSRLRLKLNSKRTVCSPRPPYKMSLSRILTLGLSIVL